MLPEYTEQTGRENSTIMVIGIGNDYRRDDAVGLLVARALKKRVPEHVRVLECAGASLELMDMWEGAGVVILVDAVSSGADPGTIYHIEVGGQTLPSYVFHYSTHGFDVADVIEFARTLGKLPPQLAVFGVECADFGQGTGLSKSAAVAVDIVTTKVLNYVLDRAGANER